jgi:hypothetical protein
MDGRDRKLLGMDSAGSPERTSPTANTVAGSATRSPTAADSSALRFDMSGDFRRREEIQAKSPSACSCD